MTVFMYHQRILVWLCCH